MKRKPVCEVIVIMPSLVRAPFARAKFGIWCNQCERSLGEFSQHESAMNWAQAHAWGSKHRKG